MDWEARCRELQERVKELENENRELRHRLGLTEPAANDKPDQQLVRETSVGTPVSAVHMRSTPEEKIRLFRSLFRGREDVYARRWYSVQKKKSGYTPVCANEWRYGVCVSSRRGNAPSARTESWFRWTMLRFTNTSVARIPMGET